VNLYLLRHGLAIEPGTHGCHRDADRPLTAEGEKKLDKIAEAMKRLEISFDLIVSSPYLRARQTAEIVADAFKARQRIAFSESLVPGGSARQLMEHLRHLEPNPHAVLVVGHEPDLSGLISWLVTGERGLTLTMKKGGLCNLAIDSLKPGRCACLEWLLTPKQMGLMS
jgi:phosphohistidine phosphatase